MTKDNNRKQNGEARIKFVASEALKRTLQELTNECNITLSALLHRITSPYVQAQQPTIKIISVANQ